MEAMEALIEAGRPGFIDAVRTAVCCRSSALVEYKDQVGGSDWIPERAEDGSTEQGGGENAEKGGHGASGGQEGYRRVPAGRGGGGGDVRRKGPDIF